MPEISAHPGAVRHSKPEIPATSFPDSPRAAFRKYLIAITVASAALRMFLVIRGGQNFWIDESDYLSVWVPLRSLSTGDFDHAIRQLLSAGSVGFRFLCFCIAPLHFLYLRVAGLASVDGPTLRAAVLSTSWFPALFLSLASAAIIPLIYAIARRVGAQPAEAFFAAFLAAGSNALLYYSRHLLPYDCSLAVLLSALYLALGPEPSRRASFLCGMLAMGGALIYAGYWSLAALIVLAHVLIHRRDRFARAAAVISGFLAPLIFVQLVSLAVGANYLAAMSTYATEIRQGDFLAGWVLPWQYLWSAERASLIVWLGAIGATFVALRHRDVCRRVVLWTAFIAALYLALAIPALVHIFVVYGRTARLLVPFICLAAAAGLQLISEDRLLRAVVIAIVVLASLPNFAGPVRQRFPIEVVRETERKMGPVREIFPAIQGSRATDCPSNFEAPHLSPSSRFVLVNACRFVPSFGHMVPVPAGIVLWRSPHPLQFRPYQFEGLTSADRKAVSSDFEMSLIRIE